MRSNIFRIVHVILVRQVAIQKFMSPKIGRGPNEILTILYRWEKGKGGKGHGSQNSDQIGLSG